MDNNEKFVALTTKISPRAYERMVRLAKKRHLTIYVLLQMVCDTLIRYMDSDHNLTEEIERAMSIFEHMEGWPNALNLADPSAQAEVGEAFYCLFDPTGTKKGTRIVYVRRPFFGRWEQTYNIQDVFERFMERLMPQRYKRLLKLRTMLGVPTTIGLLDIFIDRFSTEADLEELRAGFEDNARSEYGHKPNEDVYKRKHRKSVNNEQGDLFQSRLDKSIEDGFL